MPKRIFSRENDDLVKLIFNEIAKQVFFSLFFALFTRFKDSSTRLVDFMLDLLIIMNKSQEKEKGRTDESVFVATAMEMSYSDSINSTFSYKANREKPFLMEHRETRVFLDLHPMRRHFQFLPLSITENSGKQ